jgi:POT family proton-dependent oligopeptide transporter
MFFIFYYQQPTSLTLFIERNVHRTVFDYTIPTSVFWTLNPIWILTLGPALHLLYKKLGRHNPKITVKFGMGLLIMSLGYFTIAIGTHFSDHTGHISASWIIASYFFQSLSELLISALGTAMVVKLVPKQVIGVVMGAWFFTSALSGLIAGKLASLTAIPKTNHDPFYSLAVYRHAFLMFGGIALAAGIIACLSAPLIIRLTHAQDAL